MFPPYWREESLEALESPFDLVVVGGGINGCGIFFDAAQRGLRVLLVEKQDLAAGTSSRSSKLIHGGLRYLKNLQIRMTRASVRERDRHLALDPHLVTPLPWLYPAYETDETPGWQVELGLRVYDRMTRLPEKHRRIELAEVADLAPGLPLDDLERALLYRDARVDDARLTWAVAASGAAWGGHVLTRVEPEEALRDADGRIRGLVLRDLLTGDAREVEAALVVNATGAWVDGLRERFGLDGKTVRPSRGSHVLLDSERLPLRAAVSIPHPDDRRPVFFIPHPEGVLVGTTDLFHDESREGPLDDPRPTGDEIDYLLAACGSAFPDAAVGRGDVRGSFAGVRPVLDRGADDPSAASREEAIWHEEGLLSVAGGKLTTWRLTAEEAVDEALGHLPQRIAGRARPCATEGASLAGLSPPNLGERLARRPDGPEPPVASAMARRLGSLATVALELATGAADLRPLRDDVDLCRAELRAHLRFGAVVHLSDLLLRRVRLGMWRPDVAAELAGDVALVAAEELGWSADRVDEERERFVRDLESWSPP